MLPFPPEHEREAHLLRLAHQGYTIVHDAVPPDLLKRIRDRFAALVESAADVATAVCDEATGIVNLNRLYELDPVFEDLMDLPTILPILQDVMAGDVTLLGGAIGQHVPAGTPSDMHWHVDGDYVRLTYLLDDLSDNGGGTALVPGTQRTDQPIPAWCNSERGPCEIPGSVRLTGPAGSCMINYTMLWHTRTPNRSDQPRRTIWQVYKRSAQPLTSNLDLRLSQAYIARQTDPVRRFLVGAAVAPKH